MSEAINTMPDGTCRLIKSQYAQTSVQNFESQASFGATGVVNVEKVDDIEILGGLEEGSSQRRIVYDSGYSSPTLQAAMGAGGGNVPLVTENIKVDAPKKIKIRQATKQGFIECEIGGVCCLEYPTSTLRRARTIERGQISPTITTENIPNRIEFGNPDFYNFLYEIDGEIYLIRIRKLIPKECWRLMGFSDEDFEKAEKVNSNTQLYKQAGNSIVCNVLEAIFSQMNIQGIPTWNETQKE